MSREQPTPEDRAAQQAAMQSQGAAANAAVEQALQEHEMSREDILDKLREADVDGTANPQLGEDLGPALSGVWPIANIDGSEYRRHRWLNENEKERIVASHNPGRLCSGALLELANGTHDRPDVSANQTMTADEVRYTREAVGKVRTALQSLGKGGEGLSAVADITAVTEHKQSSSEESEEDGRLRSALKRVYQ